MTITSLRNEIARELGEQYGLDVPGPVDQDFRAADAVMALLADSPHVYLAKEA